MNLLMLTVRMKLGFGVSVVIDELCKRLRDRGIQVSVGAMELERKSGSSADIFELGASAGTVQQRIDEFGHSHVIAHSSPLFEILPKLNNVRTWAWEHGDPDPEFFDHDSEVRKQQRDAKRNYVYPNVTGVIAISEFVRYQIGWPAAQVVPNGCEHALSIRADSASHSRRKPSDGLRVGCLMRLGVGESNYKGHQELLLMARELGEHGITLSLMGRGTSADAEPYRRAGIEVTLNASDAQRDRYLADLDVMVSPSLWEGCNLPVLEAQAAGTVCIAFDTGAHPEYAYVIASGIGEAVLIIRQLADRPEMLARMKRESSEFALNHFSWDMTVDKALKVLLSR